MKKLKGFTLIELLVVISIIALLLAILMPALQRVRNKARTVVCQSNLKQWGTIFYMYIEDNHGRFFSSPGDALWFVRGSQLEPNDPNRAPMSTYVNAKDIACCPLAKKAADDPTGFFSMSLTTPDGSYDIKGITGSAFKAWKITNPAPAFHGSYGFNMDLLNSTFYSSRSSRSSFQGITIYNVNRANRFPVLLDCALTCDSITISRSPFLIGNSFCFDRHGEYINCLFMDWSVRKVGLKELWTLKWNEYFDTANRWTLAGGAKPEYWPEWMRGFKDY